jgi:mannose-6-phosphate isomerase-like protein (cupin superfamily)
MGTTRTGGSRKEQAMIVRTMLLGVAMMLLAGLASTTGATLAAQEEDPLAGTTVEMLGAIEPAVIEGWNLVTLRITMAPGAEISGHSHPGPVVLVVESGVFVTEFVHGSDTITRAAVDGTPAATETAETGVEMTLEPGDSLAYDQTAGHTMVNGGGEPLVLLVSALLAIDQPGFMFDEGTPVAMQVRGFALPY